MEGTAVRDFCTVKHLRYEVVLPPTKLSLRLRSYPYVFGRPFAYEVARKIYPPRHRFSSSRSRLFSQEIFLRSPFQGRRPPLALGPNVLLPKPSRAIRNVTAVEPADFPGSSISLGLEFPISPVPAIFGLGLQPAGLSSIFFPPLHRRLRGWLAHAPKIFNFKSLHR